MRVEYNVTYRDFLESIRGYRQVSWQARGCYWLRSWVLPLVGSSMIGWWLALRFSGQKEAADSAYSMMWLGIFLIAAPLLGYSLQLRAAFRARTSASMDGPVVLEFDENEVTFSLLAGATVRYPWTAFTAYRETPIASTLFIQRAAFHTIPKNAMTEGQWHEFRTLIARQSERV